MPSFFSLDELVDSNGNILQGVVTLISIQQYCDSPASVGDDNRVGVRSYAQQGDSEVRE
jgi:hypothetical protein